MLRNFSNPFIKHVFVLMLENRSFDHMLGFLHDDISHYYNYYRGKLYHASEPANYIMSHDPHHGFNDVVEQLCGENVVYSPGKPYPSVNNGGFISNYAKLISARSGLNESKLHEVMSCYNTSDQLPIITSLAENFAVCDNWFSSMPGPTWPNRFFAHAASSGGLDHGPSILEIVKWSMIHGFTFPNGSIFDLLKKYGKKYRLYRGVSNPLIGCIPSVASIKGINIWNTRSFDYFEQDIYDNYSYDYTFIEPNYGDFISNSYAGGQSQHPMDDVRGGEELIKTTYETIRNSPIWENSLLIITYDEHGGFYDHVPPPSAVIPGDTVANPFNKFGFSFDQYGVRVPAIVISAYTQPQVSHILYDHSSIAATLSAIFDLPSLTKRDAAANDLTSLAALSSPRGCPDRLPTISRVITQNELDFHDSSFFLQEEFSSADEGNLPSFLHILLKEKIASQSIPSLTDIGECLNDYKSIKSKADARAYVQENIWLLSENREFK